MRAAGMGGSGLVCLELVYLELQAGWTKQALLRQVQQQQQQLGSGCATSHRIRTSGSGRLCIARSYRFLPCSPLALCP